MSFNYKTRIDPKTGRAETYCDNADDAKAKAEKLARDKRELRDMLAGNTQFHTDPNAAPIPVPEATEVPPVGGDASHLGPGCVMPGIDHRVQNNQPPGDGWVLSGHIGGRRVWIRHNPDVAAALRAWDEAFGVRHA